MTEKLLYLVTHHVEEGGKRADVFDYMNLYNVTSESLRPYNCIVITGQCDQEYLLQQSDVITSFLNDGKVVVFCGNLATPWLQGASLFVPKTITNFKDYELQIPKENPIYDGVEINDMIYNKGVAGFFARGHHVPTNDVDVYLTIGEGNPATYVDRNSTRGTILVHSGYDLFGYDMNAGKTTDRIAGQLIDWCYKEIASLEAKRGEKRRRIGVIYSGTSHHIRSYKTGEFAKHISKIIPVRNLATASFDDIDVLIVPSQTNMNAFLPYKQRVEEFADQGGIVVSFGHQNEQWLDEKWELRPTNFWWWLEQDANSGLVLTGGEHDLFKNYITLADATWHQHGVYWPGEGTETLVATEDGGSVLYIDRTKSKGTWIITTLDPDFHYGHYFMPATERFLRGFLPWLEQGEI